MSLHTLVYTSVAKQKLTDEQLKDLLQHSRKKNAMTDITGMLLYLDPFFIQVLEGREDTLSVAFNRIKNDSRHHKVSIIYKKPILQRAFANWTMGFNIIDPQHVADLEGYSDFLQKPSSEFLANSPAYIAELLNKFKQETLF